MEKSLSQLDYAVECIACGHHIHPLMAAAAGDAFVCTDQVRCFTRIGQKSNDPARVRADALADVTGRERLE